MRFALVCGSALLLAMGTQARAAKISGGGMSISGSGTLTATANDDGQVVVTTLTSDTFPVTLIAPAVAGDPNSGFHGNDNVLQSGVPNLTVNGLAFFATTDDGTYEVDLFGDPDSGTGYSGYILDYENDAITIPINFLLVQTQGLPPLDGPGMTAQYGYSFSAATAPTPEPASVALLGTGLLAFAGVARRRMR